MNTTGPAAPLAPVPEGRFKDQVNALIASFLGWTLDAFDFFLVPMSLGSIAKDFGLYDKAGHIDTTLITFSLTLTLMFRPVGAFLFGLMADRYGRRLPLMLDLIFYSVVEVATGFAPNLTTFLILRALFGIGMGGEWGVGASLAMEKVPARWRGVLSGLLQEGYAAGQLIAALVGLFVLPHIENTVVFHIGGHACYGWRILFFIGGLPALLALFVRVGIKESEVWEKTKHASWGDLFNAIGSHWKPILSMIVLMTAMMCASHGTQDLYPRFLQADFGFSIERRQGFTAFTALGSILGGVVFGLWSDKIGRRRAMMIAFCLSILVIPLWACYPSSILPQPPSNAALACLLVGGFLIQFGVQGAWGIIPAHLTELSPDSVRGFVPGFAYQMGALLSSGVMLLQDALRAHNEGGGTGGGYGPVLSLTALIIFVAAIAITAIGKEKRGIEFGASEAQPPGGFPITPSGGSPT